MIRSRDDILRELEVADSSLAGIERTCGELKERIAALQLELAALSPTTNPGPALPPDTSAPHTPADKVKLFRSLFRPLFLAMPISWKGTLIQYAGRLHRHHPRKIEVRIYDYVDREVPMLLRMFERRLTTYRAIGYAGGETPLGFGEPPPELTVEYDEEALRHFDTVV